MAVKRCESSIDVVKAAEIRITNVFNNGLPVYMSFSGGKDSLCMAQLIYNLVQRGKINPSQLVVQFIDEEAIFPCIEETVKTWRKRFLLMGARFEWYCLEVKHYNCFNELSNDETFICWDHTKENVWVRRPPAFAIRNHPLLRPRIDAYQDFLPRTCQSGITITGIRTAESVQRLQNIASMIKAGKTMTNKHQVFPIYDWTNNDVWLYLLNEHVDIPEIYLFLWQAGTRKGQLRVSQFFSVDTARSLVKMNEYYPNKVSKQNLELLTQSIFTNGWTLPIVVRPDYTIIDGFHRWTVAGPEWKYVPPSEKDKRTLFERLGGKVLVVIVDHKDKAGNIYGTVTHNRARGTHLLEPMKKIVKELMEEGKSVEEIGKQLGMRPEEIFRLSEFSKEDFLKMMVQEKKNFSKAEYITKI